MSVYGVLLLCLLLLPLLFLMMKKKKQGKNLPPGPPKLPIIVPTVVVSSAETARQVLKDHDLESCSRPLLVSGGKLSYNYLDIGFSPYSSYWREMRKICVLELFSNKRVQSFRFIREQEVDLLIDSISESSELSSPVDLSEKVLSLIASMTCRTAFGKKFQGNEFDEGNFEEIFHEAVAVVGAFTASDFLPYVGWIIDRLTGFHDRLEKSFNHLDGFYQKVIDQHLNIKHEEDQQDLVAELLKLVERSQTEYGEVQFTQDHVKAILMDIFLAGVETTATTITWAMAHLSKEPRVMKKVQEEIRNCIGNKGKVTEGDIEQFKYLKMVMKETLRLNPPGRDPDSWKFPEEFIPERFEDGSIDYKGQNFEFFPFGAGRRGCPGMNLGLNMVELALANLLYCFDWKLPNGMKEEDVDMEEMAGLVLYKKVPLKLVPVRCITGLSKD
ncbi:Cytochrome P450 [Quillaja saponaria]|uniref:Cytochrome P450 n=1 Tax=Quillaja saponaria TaxID=32244 RepID=A0AAD7M2E3_QUISA|nr:Cytochrome P450 [Quillaja saponaria]